MKMIGRLNQISSCVARVRVSPNPAKILARQQAWKRSNNGGSPAAFSKLVKTALRYLFYCCSLVCNTAVKLY